MSILFQVTRHSIKPIKCGNSKHEAFNGKQQSGYIFMTLAAGGKVLQLFQKPLNPKLRVSVSLWVCYLNHTMIVLS